MLETAMLKLICGKMERAVTTIWLVASSWLNLRKYRKFVMSCMKVTACIV
jgi:hypothetical protein